MLIVFLIFPQTFWLMYSQNRISFYVVVNYLIEELKAVFGNMVLPGTVFIFVFTFFLILFSNLIGLFPYVFTNTSHIVFTLKISFPVWIGTILYSMVYQSNMIFTHLVPRGTPNVLIPVIVIIETVRNVIRPFTLCIRLAANMIAGHLLLSLLGSNFVISRTRVILSLLVIIILLLVLELAVACIQSYVFMVLSSLYINELNRYFLIAREIKS